MLEIVKYGSPFFFNSDNSNANEFNVNTSGNLNNNNVNSVGAVRPVNFL